MLGMPGAAAPDFHASVGGHDRHHVSGWWLRERVGGVAVEVATAPAVRTWRDVGLAAPAAGGVPAVDPGVDRVDRVQLPGWPYPEGPYPPDVTTPTALTSRSVRSVTSRPAPARILVVTSDPGGPGLPGSRRGRRRHLSRLPLRGPFRFGYLLRCRCRLGCLRGHDLDPTIRRGVRPMSPIVHPYVRRPDRLWQVVNWGPTAWRTCCLVSLPGGSTAAGTAPGRSVVAGPPPRRRRGSRGSS